MAKKVTRKYTKTTVTKTPPGRSRAASSTRSKAKTSPTRSRATRRTTQTQTQPDPAEPASANSEPGVAQPPTTTDTATTTRWYSGHTRMMWIILVVLLLILLVGPSSCGGPGLGFMFSVWAGDGGCRMANAPLPAGVVTTSPAGQDRSTKPVADAEQVDQKGPVVVDQKPEPPAQRVIHEGIPTEVKHVHSWRGGSLPDVTLQIKAPDSFPGVEVSHVTRELPLVRKNIKKADWEYPLDGGEPCMVYPGQQVIILQEVEDHVILQYEITSTGRARLPGRSECGSGTRFKVERRRCEQFLD